MLKAVNQQGSLFELGGIPEMSKVVPLSFQHVLAMIAGCVTPSLIIANVAGINSGDKVLFVQAALVVAAISTMFQLFPVCKFFGSGLPMIMGVGFGFVPSLQAIASGYGISAIFGAQLVGGIVAVIVGVFIKQIRRFFPPIVTGTVVFTTGLSLYPTAINYMAGGAASPEFGSARNWIVAILTLCVVIFLNHYTKGILKLASILLGMCAGYVLAFFMGMVDFSSVASANYFELPKLMYFGVDFEISTCIALGILFIINSIQCMGDMTATTMGALDRQPTDTELKGGIIAYGVTNAVGGLFGGLPTATYSQNVGIVTTTKVVNRTVIGLTTVILLLAGIFPKISAILTTIPQCVLGGATISVFASIAMTGIKLMTSEGLSSRNVAIVGLAVALGMGLTQVPQSLAMFPEAITMIFAKTPIVVATIVAIFLNIILPKEDEAR